MDGASKIAQTVEGGVSTTGTTTFTNQNPINTVRVVNDLPHCRELVDSSTTGNLSQTVTSFLAKPVPVNTGFLTPANLAGSLLFKFDIAPTMLAQPIWADKLKGFMNFRGTARIRLQVNANPFMAGRLILAYIPQFRESPTTFSMHLTSLIPISQLPHAEMSLQDAECELIIPYIAPTTHYNVQSGFYDWGTVFCYVYSSMATGTGANQAPWTAWMSFDDFEVEVPVVPQSFSMVANKKNILKKYRVNAIKSSLDSEINEGKGPISSALSGVSSVASSLASFPMLSAIAGPAAWASNLMSGVASAFGWSKPIYDTPAAKIYPTAHPYNANINEPDFINNLGLIADNRVSVMPDVNMSGVDEMSLSFIAQQKSYWTRVTWNTTTLPGPLYSMSVIPSFFSYSYPNTPFGATSMLQYVDRTPIAYLSKFYNYWRGSIEITIKIVKTEYHTGRLILAFSPQNTQTTITNSQSNYVHREIIDLRDGYEFVIKVPYCYNSVYLDTDQALNDMFMMLQVNVLNELVAPDTCAQFVDLLFEVRGGPDLEFQTPRKFNQTPALTIVPQSGGEGQTQLVLDNNIGGSVIHAKASQAAQLCIGESSTSLLQLLKRFQRPKATAVLLEFNNIVSIWPYLFGGIKTTGVVGAGTSGYLVGDYIGAIACCYAHSRGSIRYKIIGDEAYQTPPVMAGGTICKMMPFDRFVEPAIGFDNLNVNSRSGTQLIGCTSEFVPLNSGPMSYDPPDTCGGGAQIPMYSRTFCRINRVFFDNTPGTTLASRAPDINKIKMQIITTAPTFADNADLHRCVADDFHFSFWLGVPTMGWILN